MIRFLAAVTILFLSSSTLLSGGWFCVPCLSRCCDGTAVARGGEPTSPASSRSCSAPFDRGPATTATESRRDGGCRGCCQPEEVSPCCTAENECIERMVAESESAMKAAMPEGCPAFARSYGQVDATRCPFPTTDPGESRRKRCAELQSLLIAMLVKEPITVDTPLLSTLDISPWVVLAEVGPPQSPPRSVSPTVTTPVLRI